MVYNVYMKDERRKPTTIRFTERADRLLDALADKIGVSRSAVIEMAIREKADREGVSIVEKFDD